MTKETIKVVIFFLLMSFIVISGGLHQAGSDPAGTTVVSQYILHYHSPLLTGSYANFFSGHIHYLVRNFKGKTIYNPPIGTPVIIIPIVALANLFKLNALSNDLTIQMLCVFVIVFFIFWVTYNFNIMFFPTVISALLSVLMFFGTIIGPTIGSGLWDQDLEILFTGLTLLILIKYDLNKNYMSLILGVVLFIGFFARPTFAIVIIFTFIYLLFKNKKSFFISSIVSFLLLMLFSIASFHFYGKILPPYYLASGKSGIFFGINNFIYALSGFIYSPSRSMFIYSPVLLILFFYWGPLFKKPFIMFSAMALAIMIVKILSYSFFYQWWGGWVFGPRYMAGATYIGYLLSIIAVGYLYNNKKIIHLILMFILLFIGLIINIPGMYNTYALAWTAFPDINKYPNVIFSYRYPQFTCVNKNILMKKCLSQTKEFRISNSICSNIYPLPKMVESEFASLYKASKCYFKKDSDYINMSPFTAEQNGCLNKLYGGYSKPNLNWNWTKQGGWLGLFNIKQQHYVGVGIEGKYAEVRHIIKKYKKRAIVVYFPYPKIYNPNNSKNKKSGRLFMVFRINN